jgi:hypothetical protein
VFKKSYYVSKIVERKIEAGEVEGKTGALQLSKAVA